MHKKLAVLAVLALGGTLFTACGMFGGGSSTPPGPKNSVSAVQAALAAHGVSVTGTSALSDKLGGKAECTPVERKRLTVAGGYVNVGNYGDAGKADSCWNTYSAMGAKMGDYEKEGSWILELKDTLPEDTKSKARSAFGDAID